MLTQYSLKNKMRVLLMHSHKSPVASVQVWVKTGSADETKGEEGISHFIEHLVFKGTQKYGVGEIASVVEGSGGELNAYTTFDHTVFHVTISSQFIDVGLDTISQMMGFPTFDPAEINNEREVVIEEIKRSFDSPSRVSSQQIFSTVFKKHAYGIPVIGYEKIIRKVTPKTLKNYYHRRYVPQNMTVVLSGDLPADIKTRVNQYFGKFEAYKLAKVKRKKEPKQSTSRIDYKVTEFKEAQLNLSFVLPSIDHADLPAVDVLGMIFGQGDTSRLMQVLRLEKPLVTSVSSGAYNPIDAGLFIAGLSFQAADFKEIEPILNNEFRKLIYEGVTEEELFRAKQKIESDEIFSLETVDGLARKIGTYHVLLNDAKFFEKYLKAIQKLTVADLQKVAKRYLVPQKMSATLSLHKDDASVLKKADFAKWVKSLEKTLVTKPKASVSKKKEKALKFKLSPIHIGALRGEKAAHTEKITLPTGAHLFIRHNPETPCYSLRAGFLGGSRVEPVELQGLVHALSNTWTTGTKKLSEQQIAEQIESTGASLSAFGGRNSFGLNLDGISKFQKENLNLFAEVLANPGFAESFVEREKSVQRENIRSKADYPSSVTIQAFHEEIFSNHPYSRDSLGKFETVEKISSQGIHKYFSKWAVPENLYLVAVGDVDKKLLVEELTEATKHLGRKAEKIPQFGLPPIPAHKTKFMSFDKNQTHIVVGFQGLSIDDPDKPALQIIQSILSGQGGRLFLELRDKASLAYSVSPIEMEGVGAGYFGGYIACSPEKAQKAIAMLRTEFSKLVDTPMTADELAKAKRYLVGRHDIDLQRNSAQASQILFEEIYGLDSEKSFHYEKVLEPVTSKEVQRVANRIFSPEKSEVVVAVGAQDPFV